MADIPLRTRFRPLYAALLLASVCLLVYLPSLRGEPLLDDDMLLMQNKLVRSPDGLAQFWFSTQGIEYYPVSYSTFWVEWSLWGNNSLGYHLTNLVLHIAASFLVWLVFSNLSLPGAFLAALLFAVHPVNVESVAWMAQRRNVLAMVFFLLTILAYFRNDVANSDNNQTSRNHGFAPGRWYWLSVVAFLLAMLSKGSVAITPLLLWLITWWQSGRITFRDLQLSLPYWIIAVVFTGVNIWYQTHALGEIARAASFEHRLLGAGTIVWFYLSKALLPIDLAFIYPMWNIASGNLLWWFPSMAAYLVTIVLMTRSNRAQAAWPRALLFAWGFFCVALLPVMGFTHIGFMKFSLVADHYQHIALLAVVALAAAVWSLWLQSLHGTARKLAFLIPIVMVAILGGLSWHQNTLFADPIALYRDTLEKNPDCWLAHNNLAGVYSDKNRFAESIEQCVTALRLKPDSVESNYSLGLSLTSSGRPQEAVEPFEKMLKIVPDSVDGHYDLAIALAMAGRDSEAADHFQQVLRLSPNRVLAYNNIGRAYLQLKQPDRAATQFEHALELKIDYPQTYANLAEAYADSNRPEQSKQAALKAIELARAQGQFKLARQIEQWLVASLPLPGSSAPGSSPTRPMNQQSP